MLKKIIDASRIKEELMAPINGPHYTSSHIPALSEPLYRISLLVSLIFDTNHVEAAHKLIYDPRAFKQCMLDYGSSADLIAHILTNKNVVELPLLAQEILENKRSASNFLFRIITNTNLKRLRQMALDQDPRRAILDSILGYTSDQQYNDAYRLGVYYAHLAKQLKIADSLSASFHKRVLPFIQARDLPLLKMYTQVAYLACLRYAGNEDAQIHNFIRNRPITATAHYQREAYEIPIYAGPREDIKAHVVEILTVWLGRLHEHSNASRFHKRFFKKVRSVLLDLNNLQLFKLSSTHRKQVIERFNHLLQVSTPKE